MKLFDHFQVSNESIDFQKDSILGKEVENVFTALADIVSKKNTSETQKEVLELFTTLEAIVKKYTGLTIQFLNGNVSNVQVMFSVVNPNMVLFDKLFRTFCTGDIDETLKDAFEFKKHNIVDLKSSKVSGIFSTFKSVVTMNLNLFNKLKFTPGHLTALFLHELGHVFTQYEFITRQVTTNQVLSSVMRTVINKDNIKQKEVVFKKAFELLNSKDENINDIINSNDAKIVATVFIKKSFDNLKSELGVSNYDYTSCEALADQFASRHGYGREVIEALDILHKNWGSFEKNAFVKHTVNITQMFSIISAAIMSTLGIVVGFAALSLVLTSLYAFLLLCGNGETSKNFGYDILKTRYLRIREDMIQFLKDKDLDPKYIKDTLEDIKVIDKLVATTHEQLYLFDKIANFINPYNRKLRNSVELQRDLEVLSMNDFFIKSAELSTI